MVSCYRVPDKIEPKVSLSSEENQIKALQSPFTPLSKSEKETDWGREYTIAHAFAEEFDLYRAISTFKRARVLLGPDHPRSLEIDYFMMLCYYLAKKYQDVITFFEQSQLIRIDPDFPAYQDLLIIMHESYYETGSEDKAAHMLDLLDDKSPQIAERLDLSDRLRSGDTETLYELAEAGSYDFIPSLIQKYEKEKKSVGGAQMLNAVFPGSGYFYLGLTKSGLTSLTLNGLFIYATYYFFKSGHIAAGCITLSFEMGWYFGGIYGAGEQAKYYNERIYEKMVSPVMQREKLFPVFMLRYGF
jgi:tetratricopeptide (TPR) repeat protein